MSSELYVSFSRSTRTKSSLHNPGTIFLSDKHLWFGKLFALHWRLIASALFDSAIASGVVRSWKLLHLWPWNFYHMSSSVHKVRKFFGITWLVCKLQTKILKNLIFWNATSRRANFTKFCKVVTIDVRNKPWKNSDRYLIDWPFYRTICKMAPNAGL